MFNVEQTISEIKDFIQKNNIKRDCKALADFLFKKGFYWANLVLVNEITLFPYL